jgi:hypothetical protein
MQALALEHTLVEGCQTNFKKADVNSSHSRSRFEISSIYHTQAPLRCPAFSTQMTSTHVISVTVPLSAAAMSFDMAFTG